ncbi:PQQ-dependent sugar dehydrogenase [Microbulbifer aggregans]|uniref:PQQ-dependent sugar dehydrogenase n=1 Tax=Microbulbifer aggregans TaxID=1769779 RepID=UPI001CFD1A58|nr:PQQ-dependent sugar dehydrogenase [Microbulbifer aggregans]
MDLPRTWITGLLLSLYASTSSANYQPLNSDCDGPPQVAVGTMENTCLGLVANAARGAAFVKPRKALEVPQDGQLLVTDMGGWGAKRGILWLLEFSDNRYSQLRSARKLSTGLNLPHDIKFGPGGYIYLGEADRITRFRLQGGEQTPPETVVEGLPFAAGKHLHPLTSFVFLANGDLLVNAGSRSDDCGLSAGQQLCDEIESVGLRRYRYLPENDRWDTDYELYASGLRNSVALLVHPSGTVLQAENSTDLKEAEEPHEEINIIRPGGFYGWPYCANRNLDTGYIPDGCKQSNYIEPYSLMPPHVAPLDMIYYNGERIPALKNQLLVSWHGYRVIGNRLVSYPVDNEGLPRLSNNVTYNRDPIPPEQAFTSHALVPRGGTSADAQHSEVIGYWNQKKGVRPEGAPVGLLQLQDGSLLIVDDKNKALLRLSRGEPYMDEGSVGVYAVIDGIQFDGPTKHLLLENCSGCHNELKGNPGQLLNRLDGWLKQAEGRTLLEQKLTADSGFMPPNGKLEDRKIATILGALSEADK